MEYRKLIKFGKNSYVITLPQDWIRRNKLNKGDVLYFDDNGGGLTLSPEVKDVVNEPKSLVVNVDKKSIADIKRDIVNAYVNGSDIIKVEGKDLSKDIKEIRYILHHLVAFEILEQTNETIVAKHFLNINDISINDLIRRTDRTLRSIFSDIKNNLNTNNKKPINTTERSIDVNRIGYLMFRVIKMALKDVNTAKKINLNSTQLMLYWWLSRQLEVICKGLDKLSESFNEGFKSKDKNLVKEILKIYDLIMKEYIDAIDSFYKWDIESAKKIAARKDILIKQCDDFCERYNNLFVYRCMESLKYIEDSVRNIARVVMNNY